jgi:GxxExxY protein
MNRQDAKDAKMEPSREIDELAHSVIGAAIEVHRHLGPGYLESVYEEALSVEFRICGIPFERQKEFQVIYKRHAIGKGRMDFLVGELLVVELKAVESFAPIHSAKTISYLQATDLQLALLINFNVTLLKQGVKRVVLT